MNFIDHKYIRLVSTYLTGFHDVNATTWRFRCPMCGDSKKSQTKTRGYLLGRDDGVFFKCHNCGASCGFLNFLKEVSPELAKEFSFEKFRQDKKPTPSKEPEKEKKQTKAAPLEVCTPILRLPASHSAFQYLLKRKIPPHQVADLYYCDNVKKVARLIEGYADRNLPEHECIVIPFYDVNGNLTHIQCRFYSSDSSPRFMTFEIIETKKVWGLNKVSWNIPVSITEGPFDAMFVRNCISPGGAQDIKNTLEQFRSKAKAGFRIILDNDYRTNKDVWSLMNGLIEAGETVVLFDDSFKEKDINDQILAGWSFEELNSYLDSREFSGLAAKLQFAKVRKPEGVRRSSSGSRKA